MEDKPKLLIIGHGRHGKDTAAEYLRDYYGMKFTSSSYFCAQFVYTSPMFSALYADVDECYRDRHRWRDQWAQLITAYNTPNKTRTASEMFDQGNDLYVGMRKRAELDACRAAGLFDAVVWVDRSEHEPPEPKSSNELTAADADYFLDNNGSMVDLADNIEELMKGLGAWHIAQRAS